MSNIARQYGLLATRRDEKTHVTKRMSRRRYETDLIAWSVVNADEISQTGENDRFDGVFERGLFLAVLAVRLPVFIFILAE